jgi:hypothetical protein
MTEDENLLDCVQAPCRLELRDGSGVWIDPESPLPFFFLPVRRLPSVFKSVVPVKIGAADEESSRDDSTGGNVRCGLGEK